MGSNDGNETSLRVRLSGVEAQLKRPVHDFGPSDSRPPALTRARAIHFGILLAATVFATACEEPLQYDDVVSYGQQLIEASKFEHAVGVLDLAIGDFPDSVGGYHHKARALTELGRYEEAWVEYDRALALEPENRVLHNSKGWSFDRAGELNRALASFDRAIAIDSTYANPVNHKGWIRFRQGREEEGLLLVRQSMRLDPEYGGVYFNLSRMHAVRGEIDQAIEWLRKAIEISGKYKRLARKQEIFEGIRERREFREMVEK